MRNRQGTVVHYSSCTKITSNSVQWLWAEGKSDALIAYVMSKNGIAPCRLCGPPLYPSRNTMRVVNGDD